MSKYTHTGYIVGADARTRDDYRRKVNLRATKTMWISECGQRFRRREGALSEGRGFGNWPLYQLTEIQDNT